MSEYQSEFGKKLKQRRKSNGLTLQELSTASGVSPSHLGRVEKGERFPSAEILRKIAKPLGFSEADLFILAGYLTPLSTEPEKKPVENGGKARLDPYVEQMLSQEPVEIQRAVVSILMIMKRVAGKEE